MAITKVENAVGFIYLPCWITNIGRGLLSTCIEFILSAMILSTFWYFCIKIHICSIYIYHIYKYRLIVTIHTLSILLVSTRVIEWNKKNTFRWVVYALKYEWALDNFINIGNNKRASCANFDYLMLQF